VRLLPAALVLGLAAAGCASTATGPGGLPPPRDPETVRREEAAAGKTFDHGRSCMDGKDWDAAKDCFKSVYENYPGSPRAQEAQYLAAECAYRAGRFYGAGELFLKYAEDCPLSAHVGEVESRLYEIGNRLVEDGRRGLWGLGIFTTSEQGIHVLRRLATLLPTGPYADDALMRIGRWYAEEREYVSAEMTLDELLKNYPSSEWRLQARFLLGWTYRSDNRGPEYDGEKLRRARAQYAAYVELASSDADRAAEYAEGIASANEEIAAIDADLARKSLLRARFYRRTGKDAAALTVLREAARRWGDTEPGKECARRAEDLAADLGEAAPPAPAPAPAPEEPPK
jgi:TolA-binding protein